MKRTTIFGIICMLTAIYFMVGINTESFAQDDVSETAGNLALAQQFVDDMLIGGDTDAIDEIFAERVRTHSPTSNEFADFPAAVWGDIVTGRIGADEEITVHNIAGAGDMVYIHFTQAGTFENQILTPGQNLVEPTNEAVTIRRVLVMRFEDGQVVEQWDYAMNPLWAIDYAAYLTSE